MDKVNTRCTVRATPFLSTLFLEDKNGKKRLSIRAYRFFTIILVHLLFVLSYYVDIQILEGDITGSRIFGFHLTDPFITIQVVASTYELPTNLMIGSLTILGFYMLFGGRAFCSWVCPYTLLGEIGEKIHENLAAKKIIKRRNFDPKLKYIFFLFFIALSLASSQLIFEIFNVTGIFSRFIIYGYATAVWYVLLVLLIEIFFSRRVWCRYVCPIGATYSIIGSKSAVKISWNKQKCDHCLVCIDTCIVPHVLEITKKNAKVDDGKDLFRLVGGDCTLCGRCVDVCHHDALKFDNGLKKLL